MLRRSTAVLSSSDKNSTLDSDGGYTCHPPENREFMEYMTVSYPDDPLSEFREVDTYVCDHGGVEALEDDEEDE